MNVEYQDSNENTFSQEERKEEHSNSLLGHPQPLLLASPEDPEQMLLFMKSRGMLTASSFQIRQ